MCLCVCFVITFEVFAEYLTSEYGNIIKDIVIAHSYSGTV